MSAQWPVLLQDEQVLYETRAPALVLITLWVAGAASIALLFAFLTQLGAFPANPRLTFLLSLLCLILPALGVVGLSSRIIVTTHRLAVARGFGRRFSILYPEITGLTTTALGLRITSSRRSGAERLDLIAGARDLAQDLRQRMPA